MFEHRNVGIKNFFKRFLSIYRIDIPIFQHADRQLWSLKRLSSTKESWSGYCKSYGQKYEKSKIKKVIII